MSNIQIIFLVTIYRERSIKILTLTQRIHAFHLLGRYLEQTSAPALQRIIQDAAHHNPWFTSVNVERSLKAWATLLEESALHEWLAPYPFGEDVDRTVGLIFAGNIPLVGFHDLLAVLCAGYRVQVKLSSQDQMVTRHLMDKLVEIEPAFGERIQVVDRLNAFDLVIATGSNNSARYFDYYFGKYPHIIRKNRNGVAVLDGSETKADLALLGEDIFSYYGLGCRNVAKIFVPAGYDVAHFFEGIAPYEWIREHHKYANNYDYYKSIYLVNGEPHFDNGFLLLKPSASLASPLSVLYLEEYASDEMLAARLQEDTAMIQCVVGRVEALEKSHLDMPVVSFGDSQFPGLTDYADGINTLAFLAEHMA